MINKQINKSVCDIDIIEGYIPGLVGRVTEMHACFYSKYSNFGQYFESQVATGMAEFVSRLDHHCNNVWVAVQNGHIVGSVSIDGQDLANGDAHLRWFIIDEACRGSGIGRELLNKAVSFCDHNQFSATQLWTFKGLDTARRLYESTGFVLVKEELGDQWGTTVNEQQFTRTYDLSQNR